MLPFAIALLTLIPRAELAQTAADSAAILGTEQLLAGTRAGYGARAPDDERQRDVTILDIFENAASVKGVAGDWIDCLHVTKFNDRWVIVNVLWQLKLEAAQR